MIAILGTFEWIEMMGEEVGFNVPGLCEMDNSMLPPQFVARLILLCTLLSNDQ
jgi:hypothetical protein